MMRQQTESSSTHAVDAKPENGTAATDLPDDLLSPRPPNARRHRRIRQDRIRRVTSKLLRIRYHAVRHRISWPQCADNSARNVIVTVPAIRRAPLARTYR
jgi:hypothetical protein